MNRRGFLKSLAALAGIPFLPPQSQGAQAKDTLIKWEKLKTESCRGSELPAEFIIRPKYHPSHGLATRQINAGQVVQIDSSGGLIPYEPGGNPPIGVSENAAEPGQGVRIVFTVTK